MDRAYPGTTPWERLGVGNVSGGIASTAMEQASNMKIQQMQLANQNIMQDKEILARMAMADKQNRITAMGYGSPMGVKAAKKFMDLYDGKQDNNPDPMNERGQSEIHRNLYSSPSSTVAKGVEGLSTLKDSVANIPGLLSGSLRADRDIRSATQRLMLERQKNPQTYQKLRDKYKGKNSFLYN